MSDETPDRPWEELERLVAAAAGEDLAHFLDTLAPGEAALALAHLDAATHRKIFALLDPADSAQLVEQLADVQASEMLEGLEPAMAAAILQELESADQADLILGLGKGDAAAILAELPAAEAEAVRVLADYPGDVAGGLMITELLSFPAAATVGSVVKSLHERAETYADYAVQYVYATDRGGRLRGVVPLRDLLLRQPASKLSEIMIVEPVMVEDRTGLEELEDVFDRFDFVAVPVVDAAGRLLGLVRRSAVQEALADRADSDYRKALGIVGGEELRSMPLWRRSSRRLAWLTVNIVLNVVAASVIAFYQDILTAVVALAVFLPMISDMSGCSGNQAVAVSMRELALGVVAPSEVLRVALKECGLGILNGTVLGLLLGTVAGLWQGNPWFGLVVGGALAVNTVVAVLIGGTVPLFLRRLGFDPALASGPVLTTITDLCGFFFALSLASTFLARLAA